MNNYSIEGLGSINGGQFMELRVEGVGSNKGDIKADKILVEGVFKSRGYLEAGFIDCQGICEIYGNVRAKKIAIEGIFTMKDNQKMEAETLYCEGCLNSGGDLYVDSLITSGCIKVKGIYGDSVEINSFGNTIKKIFAINIMKKSCYSKITTIEATTIRLSGVSAEIVNGHDIIIGPGCVINTIDCSGTLKIHESSKVANILGAQAVEE